MKNKMYLLMLLFLSCASMQAKDSEIPMACSLENVSLEEAIEHLNVDAFKIALGESGSGEKVTLMLELCSRKMGLVKEQEADQFALHTIKNGFHWPLGEGKSFLVCVVCMSLFTGGLIVATDKSRIKEVLGPVEFLS